MKEIVIKYIENNVKEIFIVTIVLFIGMILSVLYLNNMEEENKEKVEENVSEIVSYIENKDSYTKKSDNLKYNLKRNLIFILLIGFFSTSIIGLPIVYLLVGYKGFSIGYTIVALILAVGIKKGIIFTCILLASHNIIYILGIYILSISGINLYKSIASNTDEKLKTKMLRHVFFLVIAIIISVVSAIIETYISNNIFFLIKKFL